MEAFTEPDLQESQRLKISVF